MTNVNQFKSYYLYFYLDRELTFVRSMTLLPPYASLNYYLAPGTERISNSNSAFYVPKSLEQLHTSGAFFLTFHDATYHMMDPFEYSLRIVQFC